MSSSDKINETNECCGGTSDINGINLKDDSDRSDDESNCEETAARKLRDELLFKQPKCSHLGDCPICFLPMPLDEQKISVHFCCGKSMCIGCAHSIYWAGEGSRDIKCPFCRRPQDIKEKGDSFAENLAILSSEIDEDMMMRVEVNGPEALNCLGVESLERKDYKNAFKCFKMTAELGDAMGNYHLALMYRRGDGDLIDEEEGEKYIYFLEEAAIAGDPEARYKLGMDEFSSLNECRAVKHWIISATLGHDKSIEKLKQFYKLGFVKKDDFAAALRAHYTAVNAMKSP